MTLQLLVDPHTSMLRSDDGRTWRCALGKGGIVRDKREGDGCTPVGTFPLRRVLYRPDRLQTPRTGLPVQALAPMTDGVMIPPTRLTIGQWPALSRLA